jgi:hypothetical protein
MLSIRSYVRSTDCNCESRSQNVMCRVNVSIVESPAIRTIPLSNTKRQLIDYKIAFPTLFTGWEKAIYFHQGATIPLAFILKLSNQFTPSCIRNVTGKGTVLNHVSESQVLNRYYLVFAYQLIRQLVQKIFSGIFDPSLNSSYSKSCFLSIFRAFLSSGKSFLCSSKLAILAIKMFGVINLNSITSCHQTSQSCIQTNFFSRCWQRFNCRVINQERNKPTSTRFELDSHCRRIAFNGEISTPNYIQRVFALGKPQLSVLPLESGASKLGIPAIPFLFEVGVFSPFRPEVGERNLKMAQCLLKRYATNFVEKSKFLFFFPVGKHRRSLSVSDSLLSLIPSFSTSSQSFVVNEPSAAHRPTQERLLFGRWVEPIFVGALGHLQHFIKQLSHSSTFNLKNMMDKTFCGFSRHRTSQTAPFSEALIRRSPPNTKRRPTAIGNARYSPAVRCIRADYSGGLHGKLDDEE